LDDVECVSYTSSAQALEWCGSHTPDVVVVDYNMPPPDGLEFIERFRSDPLNAVVPIVMVTAEQQRDLRYRALELGASDFLTKPVDLIEFRARIQNMLALADGRKKLADRAAWLADEVRRATDGIVAREKETIVRLMRAAEFRDHGTGAHILRIGKLSAALGAHAGLSEPVCEMLQMATPMHDIGKVATPDAILLKRGSLMPHEWEIMRQHTVVGFEILKDSESELLQLAAQIALSHHERFDGTGYPHGQKGQAIPIAGRICALSDVFDALTCGRPYKDPWSIERAIAHIDAGSGKHFDPDLVAAFHTALPDLVEIKRQHPDPVSEETYGYSNHTIA
ncbi:MAG TPA: HD domain-containing phosphohydrolase, partial [Candidatus Baltobacteraceae bacterium]|nr:HD domain-containing phosphohydrolase [Candidatus Baltobacteraceae bacterium]